MLRCRVESMQLLGLTLSLIAPNSLDGIELYAREIPDDAQPCEFGELSACDTSRIVRDTSNDRIWLCSLKNVS